MYGQQRPAASCPICGRPSNLRSTVCGGPAIQQLCNDCRRASMQKGKLSVQFCVGGCCSRAGAREALDSLLDSLRSEGVLPDPQTSGGPGNLPDPQTSGGSGNPGRVAVVPVDCMDMCEDGPICRLLPDRKTSRRVSSAWAARLGKDLARDRRARK